MKHLFHYCYYCYTLKPRFNEVPDLTQKFIQPGQNYKKCMEKNPRSNEPRPECKIYPDITNKCHHTTEEE